MTVFIPTPLRSYTGNQWAVLSQGATVGEVLNALDRQYPGIRFRMLSEQDTIREHIKIFVNDTPVLTLGTTVGESDELHIICALSGG